MIKKLTSILLVLSMLICATAAAAAGIGWGGGASAYHAEPTEPASTEEPTPEPTEEPTPEPTEALTPEPTEIPTSKPTKTPKPTNTPAPTAAPTAAPTDAPTQTPTAAPQTPLGITTESLPKGRVGEKYQARIEANYGDARFSIYNSSSGINDFDATGLKLSSEGVLSGTPAKAGSFKFTVSVTSDSAGQSVRKEFTLVVEAASTAAPTASPTTTPPSETNTPAPTGAIVITAAPTAAPTQPSYIAYNLWDRAAETIQRVRVGEIFDIRLIEGISEHLTFSNFYGNLPSTVLFVNDISTMHCCSIRGKITTESMSEFAVEFIIRGGRKLMLNFRIIAENNAALPTVTFPQGHYLVPFGGTKTAMLPAAYKRREDV